jgi:hypothetical protein
MVVRNTIDIPLLFAREASCTWRPEWRGQTGLEDTSGGEQIVVNAFPRFVGAPEFNFPPDMVPAWRSLMMRGRGRVNAYRMRMIDPLSGQLQGFGGGWMEIWEGYRRGLYVEPRPQVQAVGASLTGASTLVIDEREAPEPVRAGTFLSYDDWPFLVRARSGSGAAVTLTVDMLRVDIPNGGNIDLIARGLFVARDESAGWPTYGLDGVARVALPVTEYITR